MAKNNTLAWALGLGAVAAAGIAVAIYEMAQSPTVPAATSTTASTASTATSPLAINNSASAISLQNSLANLHLGA